MFLKILVRLAIPIFSAVNVGCNCNQTVLPDQLLAKKEATMFLKILVKLVIPIFSAVNVGCSCNRTVLPDRLLV